VAPRRHAAPASVLGPRGLPRPPGALAG
jgi:hypothetical protein